MSYKILLVGSLVLLAIGLSIAVVDAQRPPPGGRRAPAALAGTGFTYQGQLKQNGAPVNGTCDFQFGLWDASSLGTQVGTTQTVSSLPVTNGLFTTPPLDFGNNAFQGDGRWLGIAVSCPSGGSYTALSPRQALTPAPYALALPGLFTQQNVTSTNIIGGFNGNTVDGGVYGATIGGGGQSGYINHISANFGTIGGGIINTVSGYATTIGGGYSNTASNNYATIGGGVSNTASGGLATIGGGWSNTASGNNATIGGGRDNTASNTYATIGGGYLNTASGGAATIGGGYTNVASAISATVSGGSNNLANSPAAAVGGGYFNTASANWATIGGGQSNTASGFAATVPGGYVNTAQGFYSFAAGTQAKALHDGAFVWGDNTFTNTNSSAPNQFIVRANGGFYLVQGTSAYTVPVASTFFLTTTTGAYLSSGGTWTNASDRNAKENFYTVNAREILKRLASLPVQTWNYKAEDRNIRHIGPVAQGFYAAFQVGKDDMSISTVDEGGVALAAIQGLYQVVQENDAEIEKLKAQSAKQQVMLENLEARIAVLEQMIKANGAPTHAEQFSAVTLPSEWSAPMVLWVGAAGWFAVRRRQRGGR